MNITLSIAGFDPTGGAGIQADLKVFRRFGVHGLSIVTAITAQNTKGLKFVFPLKKDIFRKQFETLISDIKPDATKVGMLYTSEIIEELSYLIKKFKLTNIVVDPLLISTSGNWLIEKRAVKTLKEKLIPLSTVVTPNIYEAMILTGINIKDEHSMEESAKILKNKGPENVIITGGDLDEKAIDLLYNGKTYHLSKKKIKGIYHGTGCVFSSALTALLAKGKSVLESMKLAKDFVYKAIKDAEFISNGMGLLKI
jgi:hydroxymethylpyrimidine/phosphomethylpyrimidine kinase